jgi:hypothetical protein
MIYSPPPNTFCVIKSRRMRWAGHLARMGERRRAYRVWWGNRRGPLGRPRSSWDDNIRMDLQEIGWGRGQDLSGSGQE